MNRSFARFAVFALALVAALPIFARDTDQTLKGFVAADYRDAYRLETTSQRVVLRAAFAHSSEAAKSADGGAAYRDPFPGVQSLRSQDGREVLTISDPSALVAYEVADMSGVLAAVHDGRGIRFVPMNVREAGLAISAPEVVDAVGRPSIGARWALEHAGGRTQIRLQIDDAMLRYPIRVSYGQGERGRIAPAAAAAKRTLIPNAHATGFVSGVVTDAANSAPLANAVVDLYDSTGEYFNSYGTDSTGHYTATVEAGTWHVVASSSGYATELYNNINCSSGCTVTSGNAVNVTAGATTANINFALASNVATLSGNVVGPGSVPLSTIFVFLYDSAGNSLAAALTDGAGNWTAQASPGGTLYARAFNFIYPGLVDQVYNGIDCTGCNVTSGTAINAPNGTSVANINFSLHAGAKITGTVTDAASTEPLTGAFVNIYNSSGVTVTTLNVDSSGFFATSTGLAAGTYYAKATASGYDGELYDDIACVTSCTVTSGTGITLAIGQTRNGVDFSLNSAQARITGKVLSTTNSVLGGVLVRAFNGSGVPVAGAVSSFGDGAYELVLPAAGTYYVATQNSVHSGYIDQVYNGMDCTGCNVTTGTSVAVAAGVTQSNIDFHLTNNGGSVSGTVTDATTSAPIPNAFVQIFGASGAQASYGFTDNAGHYTSFSGLAAGSYYATASVFGYQTELYHNISCASGCNPTTGTAIAVTLGNTTSGVDFTLASSFARITGKVTDGSTSSPLNGVDVLVYDTNGDLAASATSDASGNYTAILAASGTYYALTSASAYPQYVNQLYDHISCTGCDPTTGTAITATIGAITADIDFGLAAAGCGGVSIQPATLPDGGVGLSYNQTLTLANGTGAATFSLLSGTLPPNLTLSSSGVISGTTTAAGVYTFVVSATDGAPCTTTREYTIEVTSNGTTVTISANPTAGTYPVSITFTATVEPVAATGIVRFDDGATTIGSATLSGGIASITVTLGAGEHDVTATYLGDGTYLPSTSPGANVSIAKGTPVISWTPGSPIVYGTPVGAAQLNATANVPGTFVYTPVAGTVLNAGTYTLSVVFTPTDTANYNNATATRQLVVLKATPVITWNPASPIVYPAPLGAAQLNATANVPGTFVYTPPAGTVLNAGTQTLSVAFTPTDTANYNNASATRTIEVQKATPVFTNLSAPTIIVATASTTISGKLTAGALVPPGSVTITINGVSQTAVIQADGTFSATFNTASLAVGGYTISFSYAGSANFNAASATSTLKVIYNLTGGALPSGSAATGSTVPFRVQIFNATGTNLSTPTLTLTAYGIRLVSSSTWQAAQTTGNGDLEFDFQNAQSGSYKFNLKLIGVAPGSYVLGITVQGEPAGVIHEVPFTVTP